jgi:hypothetical protein
MAKHPKIKFGARYLRWWESVKRNQIKSGTILFGFIAAIVVELASAAAPLVKKHWPAYNANGLIDDALATLKEVLGQPDPSSGQG